MAGGNLTTHSCLILVYTPPPPPPPPPQTGPTDLRHFDPMLTTLPATITDLVSTDRSLHLEGFDFMGSSPEGKYTASEEETPNGIPPDGDGEAPSNQEDVEVEVYSTDIETQNGMTGD